MKNLLLAGVLFLACAPVAESQEPLPDMEYTYELVTEGIQVPWGMAWLPNGDMLVTNRGGNLYMVKDGQTEKMEVTGLPDDIYAEGQGGFLDVDIHPDYANNGWIYFSYSSSSGEGEGANTAIIRSKLEGNSLTGTEMIYKATPNTTRGQHYGSRIEFDKDGYLFFSVGDRGNRDVNPQDLSRDGGKIYRLNDDGSVPADNPFVDQDGAIDAVYSYGHRNPQGMAMNPATGKIWAHEHGPRGGDEVNIIEPGNNYGWPVISYGINYNGTSFTDKTEMEGMEQPVIYWDPSIAPSGMTFVTGDKYPHWEGHLLVGSLKFNYLKLLKLDGDTIVEQTEVLEGIGRVRSLKQAPDGTIYVGVDGQGIFKVNAEVIEDQE